MLGFVSSWLESGDFNTKQMGAAYMIRAHVFRVREHRSP
jgi:hypothetical protein